MLVWRKLTCEYIYTSIQDQRFYTDVIGAIHVESSDLRTRTTTSTRFNSVKFFRLFSKNIQPEKLHCTIFHLKN